MDIKTSWRYIIDGRLWGNSLDHLLKTKEMVSERPFSEDAVAHFSYSIVKIGSRARDTSGGVITHWGKRVTGFCWAELGNRVFFSF